MPETQTPPPEFSEGKRAWKAARTTGQAIAGILLVGALDAAAQAAMNPAAVGVVFGEVFRQYPLAAPFIVAAVAGLAEGWRNKRKFQKEHGKA